MCFELLVHFMCLLQAKMGDDILNYRPTVDQDGLWEAGAHIPFDPFVSSATLLDLDVDCPKCERPINVCKSILYASLGRAELGRS